MKQGEGDHVLPDEITFVGVLCACVHEGLVTQAGRYFGYMSDLLGVKPNFAHYWCMAYFLAHVDLMQEPRGNKITKEHSDREHLPLSSSLRSELLGLACFRGDVMLGEQIANKLIEQDPEIFWCHLLLVNIYATASHWDEAAQTKERFKKRSMERVPGCSLKNLKELVHNMIAT